MFEHLKINTCYVYPKTYTEDYQTHSEKRITIRAHASVSNMPAALFAQSVEQKTETRGSGVQAIPGAAPFHHDN